MRKNFQATVLQERITKPEYDEVNYDILGWVSHDGEVCAVLLGVDVPGIVIVPFDKLAISWEKTS